MTFSLWKCHYLKLITSRLLKASTAQLFSLHQRAPLCVHSILAVSTLDVTRILSQWLLRLWAPNHSHILLWFPSVVAVSNISKIISISDETWLNFTSNLRSLDRGRTLPWNRAQMGTLLRTRRTFWMFFNEALRVSTFHQSKNVSSLYVLSHFSGFFRWSLALVLGFLWSEVPD